MRQGRKRNKKAERRGGALRHLPLCIAISGCFSNQNSNFTYRLCHALPLTKTDCIDLCLSSSNKKTVLRLISPLRGTFVEFFLDRDAQEKNHRPASGLGACAQPAPGTELATPIRYLTSLHISRHIQHMKHIAKGGGSCYIRSRGTDG